MVPHNKKRLKVGAPVKERDIQHGCSTFAGRKSGTICSLEDLQFYFPGTGTLKIYLYTYSVLHRKMVCVHERKRRRVTKRNKVGINESTPHKL